MMFTVFIFIMFVFMSGKTKGSLTGFSLLDKYGCILYTRFIANHTITVLALRQADVKLELSGRLIFQM